MKNLIFLLFLLPLTASAQKPLPTTVGEFVDVYVSDHPISKGYIAFFKSGSDDGFIESADSKKGHKFGSVSEVASWMSSQGFDFVAFEPYTIKDYHTAMLFRRRK
ncbi:MAG: hypothetical protein ACK4Q5_06020 [Saprospiraceae bacterium]